MGKNKHRRAVERKARSRETSSDTQQPDQFQAGSKLPTTVIVSGLEEDGQAVTSGCSDGWPRTSSEQATAYLTYEQMIEMEPTTKVVLDISHLLGKECQIFTIVAKLIVGIETRTFETRVRNRDAMIQECNTELKKLKQFDVQNLYHKMNSGTDMDLLKWQQFSVQCLNAAIGHHALYQAPLHVWVDDDVLAPAKRTARARARVVKPPPGSQGSAPTLRELGKDAFVCVDMEQLLCRPCLAFMLRSAVQDMHNGLWQLLLDADKKQIRTKKAFVEARRLYEFHRGNLQCEASMGYIARNRNMWTCLDVVVLGRLLYEQRIPVSRRDNVPLPKEPQDSYPVEIHITETTPELLHPIVIPDSVAAKRGYIVTGMFRPGRGIETVLMGFSDFKPDDDIMLHLRNDSDPCMLTGIISHKNLIKNLTNVMATADDDSISVENAIGISQELDRFPDNSSSIHQYHTDDPVAIKQLKRIVKHRKQMRMLHSALHGTPMRLYYTSDHDSCGDNSRIMEYLKHVSEMCRKKLDENSRDVMTKRMLVLLLNRSSQLRLLPQQGNTDVV